MAARLEPGPDGTWAAALDHFESTWIPRTPRGFALCETEVRADFAGFSDRLPACAPEFFTPDRLRDKAYTWTSSVFLILAAQP